MDRNRDEQLSIAYNNLKEGNYSDAFNVFSDLAQQDVVEDDVLLNLGWLYQTGSGVAQDLAKSVTCYEKAAKNGSSLASYYLGTIYRSKGAFEKALTYFGMAADQGHPSSAYWLGTMYLLGEGCMPDKQKAKNYLNIAKNNGHVFAKRDLALADIRGTFGAHKIISGLFNLTTSVVEGVVLSFRDPDSHKIR